ncbi:MAG: leucyl/phenylalanyl-tRNA--protein transferase [Acidimicrobiia bacterium]|nr:leucyl/phenylalanyl-tRNA--protein transferase [Acidimicrobiia bacterium]
MPTEPPVSRWVFPPVDETDADGPVVVGGDLEAGTLLAGYRAGLFPMPLPRSEHLGWWSPDPRAVLELDDFHVSRSLVRSRRRFDVTVNQAFTSVMAGCADPARPHGWINQEFIEAYTALHRLGWADSVEVWQENELVGGVYGVHIGGFFAGESMFHRRRDASKIALWTLVSCLRKADVTLFDVQWATDHLLSLGVSELSRFTYLSRLRFAVGSRHKVLSRPGSAPMENR